MDILILFNAVEAAWWILLGIVVLTRGKVTLRCSRLRFGLALFLIAFGCSDIAEIYTGAWWQPLGLLLFKAVCLLGVCWAYWAVRCTGSR